MNGDYSELIEYLDKKFQNTATKNDLAVFATKDDLYSMSSKLVPKEEFELAIGEIKQEFKETKEILNNLLTSVDHLVKAIQDLAEDHIALTAKVDRHEKWLMQVAEKLGLKFEY